MWLENYTAYPTIPNYPAGGVLGPGLDQNTLFIAVLASGFYNEMKVRALKLKLWPYRPGAGSGGGSGITINIPEGPRGRGMYIVYHDIASFDPSVGSGTVRQPYGPKLDIWQAQTQYPTARIKACPDQVSDHGEPCHRHYVTLPEQDASPWNVGSTVATSLPPADQTNPSIHINMREFTYANGVLVNTFWWEMTWYCEFFGKLSPIIS